MKNFAFRLSLIFSSLLLIGCFYFLGQPKFQLTGSIQETGYCIYWFKTPIGYDPEEVTLYGDFRSAEVTKHHFESNISAAKQVERGNKLNALGQSIGQRAVIVFGDENRRFVRVLWTDGPDFWFVQTPSIELALEFERTEWIRTAKINKTLPPTIQIR